MKEIDEWTKLTRKVEKATKKAKEIEEKAKKEAKMKIEVMKRQREELTKKIEKMEKWIKERESISSTSTTTPMTKNIIKITTKEKGKSPMKDKKKRTERSSRVERRMDKIRVRENEWISKEEAIRGTEKEKLRIAYERVEKIREKWRSDERRQRGVVIDKADDRPRRRRNRAMSFDELFPEWTSNTDDEEIQMIEDNMTSKALTQVEFCRGVPEVREGSK